MDTYDSGVSLVQRKEDAEPWASDWKRVFARAQTIFDRQPEILTCIHGYPIGDCWRCYAGEK